MLSRFSHVQLFVTLWTVALQLPLFMGSPGKNTGVVCDALLQRSSTFHPSEDPFTLAFNPLCANTYTHTYIYTHIHTHTHIHIHTHTYTHTQTHIQTHTHIHTDTQTHIQYYFSPFDMNSNIPYRLLCALHFYT